jgi:hypothetical protein
MKKEGKSTHTIKTETSGGIPLNESYRKGANTTYSLLYNQIETIEQTMTINSSIKNKVLVNSLPWGSLRLSREW